MRGVSCVLLILSCAATVLTLAAQESDTRLQAHLAAARKAQAQANCHLAAQEYHAAVQLLPRNAELRTNEGIALFCDSQFQEAVAVLRKGLALSPSLVTPHLFLGLASFRLNNFDTARDELTRYLEKVADDVMAHLWLGHTLAALNDNAEAEAHFAEVLRRDPANLDARYALGTSALEIARDKARQLEAADATGVKLLQLAAERYRSIGDEEHAAAATAEAAKRSAGTAIENAKADQLEVEARAAQERAFAAFQTVLTDAPDSYRAHEVRADALFAAHNDEAAIAEYEMVLRLNPTLPGVHETLSACLVSSGRFADALRALDAERVLTPVPSSRLLTRIGQAQHALGKDEEAAKSLQNAIKMPDVPPMAYLLLGKVQLAGGHADAAVVSLRHFLSLQPDSASAYYDLSRAYRVLGDRAAMTEALTNYQRHSQDAKARALMAPLTQDAPAVSFAENLRDTKAEVQPAPNL